MRNKKKGCYSRIYRDETGGKKDFCLEVGNDFEAFRIAVDFADLITIKNEITRIEEQARKNEVDYAD